MRLKMKEERALRRTFEPKYLTVIKPDAPEEGVNIMPTKRAEAEA